MRGPICDVFSFYILWLLYWKCFNNKLITTLVKILLKLSVTPVICLEVDCFFSENALEIDFGKCFGNWQLLKWKYFENDSYSIENICYSSENALENVCYSSENAVKIDFTWWKCFGKCLLLQWKCFENWFHLVKMLWKMFVLQWKCFENWRISDRNIHMILNNV